MKKIGIIGAGNIGCAIAKGMIKQNVTTPSKLFLSRRRNELLDEQKQQGLTIADNHSLVKECDIVILAVLPAQAKEVILDLKPLLQKGEKILVSVVSAVSINELNFPVKQQHLVDMSSPYLVLFKYSSGPCPRVVAY